LEKNWIKEIAAMQRIELELSNEEQMEFKSGFKLKEGASYDSMH
jgi:hypothetical protein